MNFCKLLKIISINLFILFFLDNALFFYKNIDNKEKVYSFKARHSAGINMVHKAPQGYINASNDSLYKGYVNFRTDDLGGILPNGGNGACKVFFVGGSTTETHWVDEKKRWPYLIGNNEKFKKIVKTYNFGVGGYNLHQNTMKMLMLLNKESPKIVVLTHQINDLGKYLNGGYYYIEPSSLYNSYQLDSVVSTSISKSIRIVLEHMFPYTYELFRNYRNGLTFNINNDRNLSEEVITTVKNDFAIDIDNASNQFKSRMHIFSEIIKSSGGRLVLIMQPNRSIELLYDENDVSSAKNNIKNLLISKGISIYQYEKMLNQYKSTMISFAKDNDIYLIDTDNFNKNDENMYDTIHFTPKGSEEFSKIIGDKIENIVKTSCL